MEEVIKGQIYNEEVDYFEVDLDSMFTKNTGEQSFTRLKRIIDHLLNKVSLNLEETKYYLLKNGIKEYDTEVLVTIFEKEMPNIVLLKNRNYLRNYQRLDNVDWSVRSRVCSKQDDLIKEQKYALVEFTIKKDSTGENQRQPLKVSKELTNKIVDDLSQVDLYLKALVGAK